MNFQVYHGQTGSDKWSTSENNTNTSAIKGVIFSGSELCGTGNLSDTFRNMDGFIGPICWSSRDSDDDQTKRYGADITYIIYGMERAPTTTLQDIKHNSEAGLHIDFYAQASSPIPIQVWRETFKGAHIENQRGTSDQNVDYTTGNVDSKTLKIRWQEPDPITVDVFAEAGTYRTIASLSERMTGQGKRTDLLEVASAIRDGMSWDELEINYTKPMIMYRKSLTDLFQREQQKRARQELQEEMSKATLRPWQSKCLSILDTQPARVISWFHDGGKGNIGKSFMSQYLVVQKGYILLELGTKRDLCHALTVQMESAKHSVPGVCFDLTRSIDETGAGTLAPLRGILQLCESICNGAIFSGKYNSRVFYLPRESRRICIFSNMCPNLEERNSLLSADRWDVHEVLTF